MIKHLIIAGVMKSSTTTLHKILEQSKSINTGSSKELHYFDKVTSVSYEDYLNKFDDHSNILLDSTPSYIYSNESLEKIKKTIPSNRLKIIVILRNPILRAFSHYQHYKYSKKERRSFIKAINNEIENGILELSLNNAPESYLHRGFYYNQINELKNLFSREQFQIYIYEEIIRDYSSFIKQVCDFISIDYFDYKQVNYNSAKSLKKFFLFRKFHKILLSQRNYSSKLPHWFKIITKKFYDKIFFNSKDTISTKDYQYLYNIYKNDIEKLGDLIDKNLSIWKENVFETIKKPIH